jgi:RNA polymerase sigma factor (TIGR02999 family)
LEAVAGTVYGILLMAKPGPHDSRSSTVTRLLMEVREGSDSAFDELVPLIYEELRGLAHAQRNVWHGTETLDTTALTHEAYLKLAGQTQLDWESRAHFRSIAARAMRQILIDYARAKRTQKRGGEHVRVSLDDLKVADPGAAPEHDPAGDQAEALIALDESLKRLRDRDARQNRIVECRFFGGMTIEDTAAALRISTATVERDWAMAKAWLYRDMRESFAGKGGVEPWMKPTPSR